MTTTPPPDQPPVLPEGPVTVEVRRRHVAIMDLLNGSLSPADREFYKGQLQALTSFREWLKVNERPTPSLSDSALLGEMAEALRAACEETDGWLLNAENEGASYTALTLERAKLNEWRALLARYDATKETR